MTTALVGYTGFVGSNLMNSYHFDKVYNSKNIEDSYGSNPDLLVYAGLRAEKFIANKFPEKDLESIYEAMSNIKQINPKTLVLISTVDVYHSVNNVTEKSEIESAKLLPYGKNRLVLEKWVEEHFSNHLIVRLPGLYGINIKKNFIYDMIHFIPALLNENKYNELYNKDTEITKYYKLQDNGFYKCEVLTLEEEKIVRGIFNTLAFSALNFTDSRGIFQFYNLAYLWNHISTALNKGIKKLNIATEPVTINELFDYIYKNDFTNIILKTPPYYNFKTLYSKEFNGDNGYIFSKEFVLEDIKKFVEDQDELSNI